MALNLEMLKLKAQARLRLNQNQPSPAQQKQPDPIKRQDGVDMNKPGYQKTPDGAFMVVPELFQGPNAQQIQQQTNLTSEQAQGIEQKLQSQSSAPWEPRNVEAAARFTGGVVNEAAKGVASFGEWLLDSIQQGAADKREKGIPGIGPDQLLLSLAEFGEAISGNKGQAEEQRSNNWVDQNWASMAQDTDLQKAAQEIGSVMVGGVGLPAVISKYGKIVPLAQKFVKYNGPQKAMQFIKGMLLGFGKNAPASSIGATITTPDNVQSVSQNGIGPIPGFVPKEIPGMSEGESAAVGNFIDNVIGNNVFEGLAMLGKGIGKGLQAAGFSPPKVNDVSEAKEFLQKVDPSLGPNPSEDELIQKAGILAPIIRKNATKRMSIGETVGPNGPQQPLASADINQDTLSAIQQSAKEYLSIIYDKQRATMAPEAFEEMLNRQAEIMVDNMVGFKRSRLSSPTVKAADADVARDSGNLMETASNKLATVDQANAVGQNFGQPIATQANDAQQAVTLAKGKKAAADAQVNYEADNNYVTQQLEAETAKGNLNLTGENFNQGVNALTGPKLLNARNLAREDTNKAYAAIPAGVELPDQAVDDLVEMVMNFGDKDELGKLLGIPLPEKGVNDLNLPFDAKKPSVREEAIEQLKADIKSFDFKHIYNVTRPRIAALINSMENAKTAGKDVDYSGLVKLKNYIDGPLTDMLAEVHPSVANARDKFKAYASKWRSTPELEKYDELAGMVKPMGEDAAGVPYNPKGDIEAQRQGALLIEQLDNTDNPKEVKRIMDVFTTASPTANATIAQQRLMLGLNSLFKLTDGGISPNAAQIMTAMAPNLKVINATYPNLAARINRAFSALRAAQGDARMTEKALNEAQVVYSDLISETQDTAAAKFVDNLLGEGGLGASVSANPQRAWQDIFSNKNSVILVRQLLKAAKDAGDVLAERGIKAQALRYLRNKWAAARPIAFDEGGESFVRDTSGVQVNRSLNPAMTSDMALLQEIYDPQTAGSIQSIAEMLSNNSALSQVQGRVVGSNTAEKLMNNARQMTSRLITIFFGVLNRPAAILRGISGGAVDFQSKIQAKLLDAILDQQIVNPNFISKSLEAYSRGDTRTLEELGAYLSRRIAMGVGVAAKDERQPEQNNNTNTQMRNLFGR